MAATYASIVNVGYGSRTNTTINVPASTANGNLLLMCHITAAPTTAPTQALPAGWTQIGTTQTFSDPSSFQGRVVHAYRIASSEPASYTVTHSTCGASGWIMRITGTGTLSIDVSSQDQTAATLTSSPTTAPSVTPTTAADLLVFSGLNWDIVALTPPAGMTERQDGQFLYVATEALASSAATGNRTQAQASTPWFGNLIAVNDVVAGGAYTITAQAGSYALAGTAATLTKAGGGGTGALPVYRSSASSGYATSVGPTVCARPPVLTNDDIMIAGIFAGKNVASLAEVAEIGITPPAGWTLLGRTEVYDGTGFGAAFMVYWKRASGEGAFYSFTHDDAGSGTTTTFTTQVVIAAYSGCVASGNPIDAFSQNDADAGSTATATGVTTTSNNTKLVYVGHNWDGSGLTPPAGMIERFDNIAYLSDEDRAFAGATGNRTQTLATSNPWSAFLVALKPTESAVPGSFSITAAAASYALSGTAATLIKAGPGTGGGSSALPVYRSIANTAYGTSVGPTVCAAPAGLANDDILVAGVFAGKNIATLAEVAEIGITPPAGWTFLGRAEGYDGGGFGAAFMVYWKRAASEGSSFTFTHVGIGDASTTFATQVVIAAYSSCATSGNPINVFSQAEADTGTTATASAVTTTAANTKLVYVGHNWDGTGLAPPTDMIERFDGLVYLSDESRPTAGATGTRTQTLASSNPWAAFLVALLPGITSTSTYTIAAAAGAYGLTGMAARLTKFSPNRVSAIAGSYNLTGTTVVTGRGLIVTAASYSFSGRPAILRGTSQHGLIATRGSYSLTGAPVTLVSNRPALSGIMSVWTGSAWVDKPVKVWTGSGWTEKPVKVWNGSAWI